MTMTVDERISLCRFLEKIEEQKTYCVSIGVRDVSKFWGSELAGRNIKIEKSSKQT